MKRRRKAIEALLDRWDEGNMCATDLAEQAYGTGRIDGLREAARYVAWWHGNDDAHAVIRGKARELAKKARGK